MFSGVLYQFFGKRVPFIILAFIALFDALLLFSIIRSTQNSIENTSRFNETRGTPIWRLLMDPYVMICAGALTMVQKKNKENSRIYSFFFR